MQLIVKNTKTGQQSSYRLNNIEGLYNLGLKYPKLHHIILFNSEDVDFLHQIVSYFNRTTYLQAKLIQDNPMLKTELIPVTEEEFKTRLNAWMYQRHNSKPSNPDIADPGSQVSDKEVKQSNSTLGRLAEKFAKWCGK